MDPNKQKALDAALSQIERQFGKGTVMRMGDQERVAIPSISTGSLGLDIALGIGGLPKGRIVEIYGPESSGKTTLTLQVIAEAQKAGGTAAFIDAEHALDPQYADKLGVQVDDLEHPVDLGGARDVGLEADASWSASTPSRDSSMWTRSSTTAISDGPSTRAWCVSEQDSLMRLQYLDMRTGPGGPPLELGIGDPITAVPTPQKRDFVAASVMTQAGFAGTPKNDKGSDVYANFVAPYDAPYDRGAVRAEIDAIIRRAPLVLFGWSTCWFCTDAERLLKDANLPYRSVYMDLWKPGGPYHDHAVGDDGSLAAKRAKKNLKKKMRSLKRYLTQD